MKKMYLYIYLFCLYFYRAFYFWLVFTWQWFFKSKHVVLKRKQIYSELRILHKLFIFRKYLIYIFCEYYPCIDNTLNKCIIYILYSIRLHWYIIMYYSTTGVGYREFNFSGNPCPKSSENRRNSNQQLIDKYIFTFFFFFLTLTD